MGLLIEGMDSLLKTFSPSTASFEETFKTAYSHGLEEIYSLENVDISSIRPIKVEPPKEIKPKKPQIPHTPSAQLTFDFFRQTLPPLYLDEPIQLLSLSKPIERRLIEEGKLTIGDILREKGEVKQRLEGYLHGRGPLVDFYSLVKCLTGDQERKKAKAALDRFHLGDIYTLTPLENMEIKRLSVERRREWTQEFNEKVAQKIPFATTKLNAIFDVFIKPWMRNRHGLATRLELTERLQRISENPMHDVLQFINETCFPLLDTLLIPLDDNLYSADRITATRYSQLIAKASTYFYKPTISYPLSELTLLLKQEFALQWQPLEDPFIEKALRHSTQFRVRKGVDGVLLVKLAWSYSSII